jgi:transcription elongation factor GreB
MIAVSSARVTYFTGDRRIPRAPCLHARLGDRMTDRRCAWCGTPSPESPEPATRPGPGTSHGICERCLAQSREALRLARRPTRLRSPRMRDSPGRRAYITPEGASRLQAELEQLWRVERPKLTREVSEAAAQGDRSENAEYIYGKRRLREIDRRVRFLRKRLDELVVVRPGEIGDESRIFFGAWVTLADESGAELRYRLVGPDEIDAGRGLISVESPLGRVLLGRREDDEVTVKRPAGRATYTVVRISYSADDR